MRHFYFKIVSPSQQNFNFTNWSYFEVKHPQQFIYDHNIGPLSLRLNMESDRKFPYSLKNEKKIHWGLAIQGISLHSPAYLHNSV